MPLYAGSRSQSLRVPVRPDPGRYTEPIVESVGALLPELHDLWSKVIATPAFWALDVVSVEPLELGREAINRCQFLNDVTLMGGNRSTTCRRGPRQPVTIGLSIAGAASYPTDPDLTVHWKVPSERVPAARAS